VKTFRVNKTFGKYLIFGAALLFMLASNAHAETPKEVIIRSDQSSLISPSNPVTASGAHLTGGSATPGFQSVQTAANPSLNLVRCSGFIDPSAATKLNNAQAVHILNPAVKPSLSNSALAHAGVMQTMPIAVKPVTLNGTQIKVDSTLFSANLASLATMPGSGPQSFKPLETSVLTTGIVNANISPSPLLCAAPSTSNLIFNAQSGARALMSNISWENEAIAPLAKIDGSHSFQETAFQVLTNSKAPVRDNTTLQAGKQIVNALTTEAKQTCAAAKMLAKRARSLSQKTASSVIDGFYAVQKSISTAKATAMKHIKGIPNLKNKVYEHTSGWIKGIIPILKLVIPNGEMPLLMDLLLQDSNTLPVAASGNEHKDPLPAPLRKALEDGGAGGQNPLSETVAREAWKPINPTHSIDIINIVKKNAVNYNKTGLSPPQTVSTNSTALLSALNCSIRSYSALDVSAYYADLTIDNSRRPYIPSYFISLNPIPLSSLMSGGHQVRDRGIFIYNQIHDQGSVS